MIKILIAGGTGLIGKAIAAQLKGSEYVIHILSRQKRKNHDNIRYFQWDLDDMSIESKAVQVDHIINLTGAGIADKRWTASRKKALIDSRTKAAKLIRNRLQETGHKVKSYISASAIGYYGDSGEQLMREDDLPVDNGFLSHCTVLWEAAAKKMEPYCERVVIVRIGIVLDKNDGAFAKMLLPFKMRMASYFADGSMIYSWIHIDDIAGIFVHTLLNESMNGIYNAVSPQPETNKDMTKIIKDVKGGFYVLNSVPTFALRTAMGEMADVVLTSNNVSSQKIQEADYTFKFVKLQSAVENLLSQ